MTTIPEPTGTMTEQELRRRNPWLEVADMYHGSSFLCSDSEEFVCSCDREMVEEFNLRADDRHRYRLNVPAYPWYGNPLMAKVIVLSRNPGYSERESKMASLLRLLPPEVVGGYARHLRSMLRLDCHGFLPDQGGDPAVTFRDIADLHQRYYWRDRLTKAFVNEDDGPTFERVNSRFAVIEYVGYSSVEYAPLRKGLMLPSQGFTRELVGYILNNHKYTLFIVPRAESDWRDFLGPLWSDHADRFIVSKAPRTQSFTAKVLGEDNHRKVIEAFVR